MQSSAPTQYRSPVVVVGIVVLLIVLGLWYGFAKATTPASTPVTVNSTGASLNVGQQQHLINPGFQTVTLFASNDDLDNGIRAIRVGDDDHAVQLAHRGTDVPAGASVVILATATAASSPSAQVRVLEGPSALRTGWVTTDKLSP